MLRDALLRAIVFRAAGYVLEGDMDSEGKLVKLAVLLVVVWCKVVKVPERVERSVDGMVMVEGDIVAAEVGTVVSEVVHIVVIEAGTEPEVVDTEAAQSDTAVAIPKANLSDVRSAGILDSLLVHNTLTLSAFAAAAAVAAVAAAVTEPVSYTPLPLYQQSPLTKPLYRFFNPE